MSRCPPGPSRSDAGSGTRSARSVASVFWQILPTDVLSAIQVARDGFVPPRTAEVTLDQSRRGPIRARQTGHEGQPSRLASPQGVTDGNNAGSASATLSDGEVARPAPAPRPPRPPRPAPR